MTINYLTTYHILALSICVMFLSNASAIAKDLPYKIDRETARKLAVEAEEGSLEDLRGYSYESPNGATKSRFFIFSELGGGEGINDFIAVNRWTGEVWSLDGCRKDSTPASLRRQTEIKQRFTAKELKQYDRLSRLKPSCINDPDEKD